MDILEGHEIILGTYEEFVLGYKPSLENSEIRLTQSFTDHAHAGCVKSVATAGKFLVTGGVDENCKIFNLRNRSEHGQLIHHDGSVNVVRFYDNKHVLTGGDDQKICILKTNSWKVEKTLVKHRGGVIDVSIHPSGKLAMSIAKDQKLITWNLIKGRAAYVTNLHETAEFVKWSPDGSAYAVGFYKRVDLYKVETAAVDYSIKIQGRANAVVFLDDTTIAIAGDMPQIEVHDILNKTQLHSFDAHETRVRCLSVITSEEHGQQILISSSNDGFVKIWKVSSFIKYDLISEVNTKCRITCMVAHKLPEVAKDEIKKTDITDVQVIHDAIKDSGDGDTKKKKKKIQIREPEVETPSPEVEEPSQKKQKLIVEVENGSQEDSNLKKKKKKKKLKSVT